MLKILNYGGGCGIINKYSALPVAFSRAVEYSVKIK